MLAWQMKTYAYLLAQSALRASLKVYFVEWPPDVMRFHHATNVFSILAAFAKGYALVIELSRMAVKRDPVR